jgi:hypothetical protein
VFLDIQQFLSITRILNIAWGNIVETEKIFASAGCQWLTPVILATQEAEIRRIVVQSQPRQIVHETLSGNKNITKKG